MGNSASTRNRVINETTINITQNYVTNNILQQSVNSSNQLYLRMSFGVAQNCPVDVNQSIKNTIQIVNATQNAALSQLASSLEQTLNSEVDASAELINGFASMTGGNATDVSNYVRNTIKKTIDTSITVNNINQIAASSFNSATGELTYLFCKDSPIKWNQEIVSEIISRNILYNIQTALTQDSTISNLVSFADQSASQQNSGLDQVIKSIGEMVGLMQGPLVASSGFTALICCILVIGILVLGMSEAGQESIKAASSRI